MRRVRDPVAGWRARTDRRQGAAGRLPVLADAATPRRADRRPRRHDSRGDRLDCEATTARGVAARHLRDRPRGQGREGLPQGLTEDPRRGRARGAGRAPGRSAPALASGYHGSQVASSASAWPSMPGVDVRVAVLLARVLHEDREGRAPVHLGERDRVHRRSRSHSASGMPSKTSVVDDPLVRDDLAVLAVEGDLEAARRAIHHVAPLAADPQVDLGARDLAALAGSTSA